MKILIELPSWLGDTVMVTPAIENIISHFSEVEITLLGSLVSTELLSNHPKVDKTYVLDRNYFYLYKSLKRFDKFDFFVSFRSSLRSNFVKFFVSAAKKYQFKKNKYNKGHQVEKYNHFINDSLKIFSKPLKLTIHSEKKIKKNKNKLLGINPGANYGDAKRWDPKKFASVAKDLSSHYDIIIFGGPDEIDIAKYIEKYLINYGVDNYQNLAASLTIQKLIFEISNLDLFITGDSGPMHIAAAFQVPTVSIFGPTNDKETSQWLNSKNKVVKRNLDCQPCMKRNCPLKHNNCMRHVEASDVLLAVQELN
jgi:heptosyltransferase II